MASIHERRHPLYEEYIDSWLFYMESFKGGTEYVQKYLTTHRLENPADYARRRMRAYYLNYCAPIATIPTDYVFKKEATRPADTNLSEIRDNIDYKKTNIHEFMRQVSTLSSIYGHIHILVDRIRPDKDSLEQIRSGKTTKQDNLKFPPYATIIHPPNLLDWSFDTSTQQLRWVIIEEQIYEDADFTADRETSIQYKVWTQNEWYIYDVDNNLISEGKHELGYVPLITCYHKDVDLDLIGESMLRDVAEANRTIFNWCSNIDEMVARQTFSQLICPDDGSLLADEVDDQGKSAALGKVGTATIFTFPAESRHAPAFISPDTGQIDTIWKMVEHHVKEMFRMAGLISARSSLAQQQQRTGRAQEFEFLDMAVFFTTKAKALENTENKLNRCIYDWLGIDSIPERVHYPEKFDIITPTEIVDLFTKVVLNYISGTLNKEMAKRLVHQVLPYAEDEIVAKIYQEIETNEILEDPTILTEGKNPNQIPSAKEVPDTVIQEEREEVEEPVKKEIVPNSRKPGRRAKFRSLQE